MPLHPFTQSSLLSHAHSRLQGYLWELPSSSVPCKHFLFLSLFSFHSNYFSPSVRNDNIVVLFISDWGTEPESKEVAPEQDISEEESTPGVLVERFPKESSSECEDSLKNQQENHEKHLIQEVGPQTKPSGERSYQCDEFGRNFSRRSLLVQQQGESRHSRDSFKKNLKQNSDLMKHEKI